MIISILNNIFYDDITNIILEYNFTLELIRKFYLIISHKYLYNKCSPYYTSYNYNKIKIHNYDMEYINKGHLIFPYFEDKRYFGLNYEIAQDMKWGDLYFINILCEKCYNTNIIDLDKLYGYFINIKIFINGQIHFKLLKNSQVIFENNDFNLLFINHFSYHSKIINIIDDIANIIQKNKINRKTIINNKRSLNVFAKNRFRLANDNTIWHYKK